MIITSAAGPLIEFQVIQDPARAHLRIMCPSITGEEPAAELRFVVSNGGGYDILW